MPTPHNEAKLGEIAKTVIPSPLNPNAHNNADIVLGTLFDTIAPKIEPTADKLRSVA